MLIDKDTGKEIEDKDVKKIKVVIKWFSSLVLS
jgi:hypothetical protein